MQIIGLGNSFSGNAAIGIAVIESLKTSATFDFQAVYVQSAEELIERLDGRPTALIDAIAGGDHLGSLYEFNQSQVLDAETRCIHEQLVREAIGMAVALRGPGATSNCRFFGVCIERELQPKIGLSHPAADKVRNIATLLGKALFDA